MEQTPLTLLMAQNPQTVLTQQTALTPQMAQSPQTVLTPQTALTIVIILIAVAAAQHN